MIDSYNVKNNSFENSHLLAKLKKIVVCARLFESQEEKRSTLVRVSAFDLTEPEVYEQVKDDYEATRQCIISKGFEHLTGRMGVLVQPRTKGLDTVVLAVLFMRGKNLCQKSLALIQKWNQE